MVAGDVSANIRPRLLTPILLGLLVVLSAALNLWNNDFPLGYHFDEPKKVRFILRGEQDFRHPLLMLQIVRGVNLLTGMTDPQQIAVAARSTTALAGVLIVLGMFFLARPAIGPLWALAVAGAVAVSPIIVVHAHYLKEDVLLTCGLVLSLVCSLLFRERPDVPRAIALGTAMGLCLATHYKAALFLPLPFMALPLRKMASDAVRLHRTFALTVLSVGTAAVVFLVLNLPLLYDTQTFYKGFVYEAQHALSGHDVPIEPFPYLFGFHLLHSLLPGMTILPLSFSLAGLGWVLWHWPRAEFRHRLLVLYVAIFYLVPEASPLKPYPNIERYMIPVVPVLLYFAGLAFQRLSLSPQTQWPLLILGTLVLIVLPLWDTLLLVHYLNRDTRAAALARVAATGLPAIYERHSSDHWDVETAADLNLHGLRKQGVGLVVTSAFQYERYFRGVTLSGVREDASRRHQGYVVLFQNPYTEIRPSHRSFAFSNPVIRIVDIRDERR